MSDERREDDIVSQLKRAHRSYKQLPFFVRAPIVGAFDLRKREEQDDE